jgi:uncharacterized metal-binding protein
MSHAAITVHAVLNLLQILALLYAAVGAGVLYVLPLGARVIDWRSFALYHLTHHAWGIYTLHGLAVGYAAYALLAIGR